MAELELHLVPLVELGRVSFFRSEDHESITLLLGDHRYDSASSSENMNPGSTGKEGAGVGNGGCTGEGNRTVHSF